jgi:hypothetical protein
MSKKAGTPKQAQEPFLDMSDLIGEAMTEYYEKQEQVTAGLVARAQALFARIAPGHEPFAECYTEEGDERVFCDVEDLLDGFGTLSFSFHPGATPEADYFQIENYMELPSSIQIYSLYDLGRALCGLTEVAQGVLKTFKRAMLTGHPE